MRLSKVKLSGFKSFVDPVTFELTGRLNGVVGPNGCGKSNIIDAVRWVMGESSARQLRGESMADVIFNGATSRKPSGFASIELVFDNREGRLGGQWASFTELSIKRVLERSGQSSYFLNGARCRRKDITDIFLGTGLGPRSYAIIEQGMISRVVESKPEELRTFFEEAAGISKYKEQRRETEMRIERTRANLLRLLDVREELQKQLTHMEKQAKKAETYQKLKKEERILNYALLKQKRAQLSEDTAKLQQQLETLKETLHVEVETYNEGVIRLSGHKHMLEETTLQFNSQQEQFHVQKAQIQNLKHEISLLESSRARDETDFADIQKQCEKMAEMLSVSQAALPEIALRIQEDTLALSALDDSRLIVSDALADLDLENAAQRAEYEHYQHEINQLERKIDLQRQTILHHENRQLSDDQQINQLEEEYSLLLSTSRDPSESTSLDEALIIQHAALASVLEEKQTGETAHKMLLQKLRIAFQEDSDLLRQRSELEGRLSALKILQQSLTAKEEMPVEQPLYHMLEVNEHWSQALESVLARWLALSVTPHPSGYFLGEISQSFTPDQLGFYVSSAYGLGSLLSHVYIADHCDDISIRRHQLESHEWLVLPNGDLYGKDWFVPYQHNSTEGVLERNREIQRVQETLIELNDAYAASNMNVEQLKEEEQTLIQNLEQLAHQADQIQREVFSLEKELSLHLKESEHRDQSQNRINDALARLHNAKIDSQGEIEEGRIILETLLQTYTEQKDAQEKIQELLAQSGEARIIKVQEQKILDDEVIRLTRKLDATCNEEQSLNTTIDRLTAERTESLLRLEEKKDTRHYAAALEEHYAAMAVEEDMLMSCEVLKTTLSSEVAMLKETMTQDEKMRVIQEEKITHLRESIQKITLIEVELNTHAEHIETDWDTLVEELSNEEKQLLAQEVIVLSDQDFEGLLKAVRMQLTKIGAVNLVAIEECKTLSERKLYLDTQDADLNKALMELETAIRRIDSETRDRFMETFDKVNQDFARLFPHLFGGGEAYLELVGNDALSSGVNIVARPPGKKPGTIHLLSGGEKALTAVALVFGIFNLNPAPFCMLDEVDAPLDEANVRRLGNLLNEMSDKVQFIFITHNKATMAVADSLIGVTMSEPGVSRLVSVDLAKAEAFANA